MRTKEQETNESIAQISYVMEQNIFKDFAKYKNRDEMLFDKWAYKISNKELVIVAFPNDDLEKYKEKFINHLMQLNNLNDTFIFGKYAMQEKQESFGGKDKPVKTGWFYPASFWGKMWVKYQSFKKSIKNQSRVDEAIAQS